MASVRRKFGASEDVGQRTFTPFVVDHSVAGSERLGEITPPPGGQFLDLSRGLSMQALDRCDKAASSQPGVADLQTEFLVSDFDAVEAIIEKGLRVRLDDGTVVELGFKPLPFKPELQQDTTYFDTRGYDLLEAGAMLRARGELRSDQTLKNLEVEFKADGARVKGSKFKSGPAPKIVFGDDSEDAAVMAARQVAGNTPLRKVGAKQTHRRLFAVYVKGKFPLFDGLKKFRPPLLIALDDEQTRSSSRPGAGSIRKVQHQVFTKFPWMKNVDAKRVALYEAASAALEAALGVAPATRSSYQTVMSNDLT